MSKTLIDLDRELTERARAALGPGTTIKDAVHEGLRRIVREHAHATLMEQLASLDDDQLRILDTARDTAW
jgi:Arc/MetJ family transcription regulator